MDLKNYVVQLARPKTQTFITVPVLAEDEEEALFVLYNVLGLPPGVFHRPEWETIIYTVTARRWDVVKSQSYAWFEE